MTAIPEGNPLPTCRHGQWPPHWSFDDDLTNSRALLECVPAGSSLKSCSDIVIKAMTAYQELEAHLDTEPRFQARIDAVVQAGKELLQIIPPETPEHVCILLTLARYSNWLDGENQDEAIDQINTALRYAERAVECTCSKTLHIIALQRLGWLYAEKHNRLKDMSDHLKACDALDAAAEAAQNTAQYTLLMEKAACMRFRHQSSALKCIFDQSLDQIFQHSFTWPSVALRKFRFIDARSFVEHGRLRIVELSELPEHHYAAVSYVWTHSNSDAPAQDESIRVSGVDAAPLSSAVLFSVCTCALQLQLHLLWIDALCIIQTSTEDKSWQIQHMFSLYARCGTCIVLPGGMTRLFGLEEPTLWMHRAWTLQESLAPRWTVVLFAWNRGPCMLHTYMYAPVFEVEPGQTARANLYDLMILSAREEVSVQYETKQKFDAPGSLQLRIIVDKEVIRLTSFLGAIENIGREGFQSAIWRAHLTRVATRPADTIFSIMGMLNVTLDPSQFDSNDRKGATLALMAAVLHNGGKAEWLGVVPTMPLSHEITGLSMWTVPDSDGRAMITAENGVLQSIATMIGNTGWKLISAPHGKMSDHATLSLSGEALNLREIDGQHDSTEPVEIEAYQGKRYVRALEKTGPPYAFKLGKREQYNSASIGRYVMLKPWLVLIAEAGHGGQLTVSGYAEVSDAFVQDNGWIRRTLEFEASA